MGQQRRRAGHHRAVGRGRPRGDGPGGGGQPDRRPLRVDRLRRPRPVPARARCPGERVVGGLGPPLPGLGRLLRDQGRRGHGHRGGGRTRSGTTACRPYSVAPGLVDTDMQAAIRATAEDRFPDVGRFRRAKEQNAFNSAPWVAERLSSWPSADRPPRRSACGCRPRSPEPRHGKIRDPHGELRARKLVKPVAAAVGVAGHHGQHLVVRPASPGARPRTLSRAPASSSRERRRAAGPGPAPAWPASPTIVRQDLADRVADHDVGQVVEGRGLGVHDDHRGPGARRQRHQPGRRVDTEARAHGQQQVARPAASSARRGRAATRLWPKLMVADLRMPPQRPPSGRRRGSAGSSSPARTRSERRARMGCGPRSAGRPPRASVPWISTTEAGSLPAAWWRPSMFWVTSVSSRPWRSSSTRARWPGLGSGRPGRRVAAGSARPAAGRRGRPRRRRGWPAARPRGPWSTARSGPGSPGCPSRWRCRPRSAPPPGATGRWPERRRASADGSPGRDAGARGRAPAHDGLSHRRPAARAPTPGPG